MDGAVLTDLERREVETERRHLPAQLGELAPRDAAETVADQRLLRSRRARPSSAAASA